MFLMTDFNVNWNGCRFAISLKMKYSCCFLTNYPIFLGAFLIHSRISSLEKASRFSFTDVLKFMGARVLDLLSLDRCMVFYFCFSTTSYCASSISSIIWLVCYLEKVFLRLIVFFLVIPSLLGFKLC